MKTETDEREIKPVLEVGLGAGASATMVEPMREANNDEKKASENFWKERWLLEFLSV